MSTITIEGKNEEAFSAVLKAFAKATDSDIIPMSSFQKEDDDSDKTVQISAKIHVPKAKRLQVRNDAAGYLNFYMQQDPGLGVEVITGTTKKPDKEKLDFVVRTDGKKKQVIRIEIKPTNVGGSGGGSAATTIQETALATFLAMRYEKGSDLVCHSSKGRDCLDENDYKKGLAKVDHNNKVKVEEIMALDSDWIQSCIKGANTIANTIKGTGWVFVRGDTLIDDGAIKKAYKRCKDKPEKSGLANEDKWNPSDIWMVKDGKQSEITGHLNSEGTIDCLNNYIALAADSTGLQNKSGKDVTPRSLIGISLKKLGTKPGASVNFKIMNAPGIAQLKKAQGVIFNKSLTIKDLTSFSAMDVYFLYGTRGRYTSFQARNFAGSNAGDWKLELKGEFAAQGKIQGQVMRDLLTAAHKSNSLGSPPPNEPKFSDCKSTSAQKTKITNEIYTLLKKYQAKDFSTKTKDATAMKGKINAMDTSWRYSKLSGLRLLDWLCGLGAGRASRAMKEMYLYASSQTDKSSTYYKLF